LTTVSAYNIPNNYFDVFNGYKLYGVGVAEPKFCIQNVQPIDVIKYPTVLKFHCNGIEYIKFFPTQKFYEELTSKIKNNTLEIVGTLQYNDYYEDMLTPQVIINCIDYVPKKETTLEDIF
jgi:hypothetical protein